MKVRTKRQKFDPTPGTYYLLTYPEVRYSQRYSHRLVYILNTYMAAKSAKTGKPLKQSYKRCTCVVVDFYKDARGSRRPYEAKLKDQMLQLVKRDVTHSSRYYITDENRFQEASLDLSFIVKFGGPNAIVREVLDRLVHRQQQWVDTVTERLNVIKSNIAMLDSIVQEKTNEKTK